MIVPRGSPQRRKAAFILAGIAGIEGSWVLLNLYLSGSRFVRYLGFAPGRAGTLAGWIAAAIVVVAFVTFAMRLASVREHAMSIDMLKLLAVALALGSGILEEVMFRRWVMDWLRDHGHGATLQILAAGAVFGAAHGIWGLFGRSGRAALGATLATGLLGAMLGAVYLLSGRSLAPCVVAHTMINLVIEPGLVLAAVRGEMGGARSRAP